LDGVFELGKKTPELMKTLGAQLIPQYAAAVGIA